MNASKTRPRIRRRVFSERMSVTALMSPDAPNPAEPGRGSIDLKAIVDAGRKAGVKHMFVEQEPHFKEVPAMEAAAID